MATKFVLVPIFTNHSIERIGVFLLSTISLN